MGTFFSFQSIFFRSADLPYVFFLRELFLAHFSYVDFSVVRLLMNISLLG